MHILDESENQRDGCLAGIILLCLECEESLHCLYCLFTLTLQIVDFIRSSYYCCSLYVLSTWELNFITVKYFLSYNKICVKGTVSPRVSLFYIKWNKKVTTKAYRKLDGLRKNEVMTHFKLPFRLSQIHKRNHEKSQPEYVGYDSAFLTCSENITDTK